MKKITAVIEYIGKKLPWNSITTVNCFIKQAPGEIGKGGQPRQIGIGGQPALHTGKGGRFSKEGMWGPGLQLRK